MKENGAKSKLTVNYPLETYGRNKSVRLCHVNAK